MRIERIRIRGFGCLTDRTYEFPKDRAVLVLEDNESGKSTLAAAILAGLCGFPPRKQAGEKLKLSDIYKPWQGDAYAVEMDISAGGRLYNVERDFARATFVVRDSETGRDITAQFDSDLARHFLHLPREDFSRLACISGKETHQFGPSTTIQARLSALVDGSQEATGGDIAIAALQSASYTLAGRTLKTETAVKRLGEEIATKQAAMRALDESMEAAKNDAARLDEARNRHTTLGKEMERLDREYRTARLREVRERIAGIRANSEDAGRLGDEMNELSAYASFPAERRAQLDGAVARAGERRHQAEALADKMQAMNRQADEIRSRLEACGQFSAAADDDPALLLSCEQALKAALVALKDKQDAFELEKRALAAEGVDPERTHEQWERFERLPVADREFVRTCRETELALINDENAAQTAITDCSAKLQAVKGKRAKLRKAGKALVAAGGLCGMAAVVLMVLKIMGIVPSVGLAVAAMALIMTGAVQLSKSGSLDADQKAQFENTLRDAEGKLESAKAKREKTERKLEALAQSMGYDDPAQLTAAFRECERALGRSQVLNSHIAQLAQLEESLESAQNRASLLLRRLDADFEPGGNMPERLAQTRDALSRFISDKQQLAQMEKSAAELVREIERTQAGADEESHVVRAILDDADIDPALPLNIALERFDEAERCYRRFREIRDSLLPAASRHVASGETLASLLSEEKDLADLLADAQMQSDRASGEVESERQAIRDQFDAALAEMRDLERHVGACVDAYRGDYPKLREELERCEREMERAARFAEAIETAVKVLTEVSRESRRRWASALNRNASMILPHLNSDYDAPRFDDSLSFTLRHVTDNRVIDHAQVNASLSTGARDQVYLAVRLACCGELSGAAEAIPLILDDPLMAADDSRFASGFRYLAEELPKGHQVIILSCHASRHAKLIGEPWFADCALVLKL